MESLDLVKLDENKRQQYKELYQKIEDLNKIQSNLLECVTIQGAQIDSIENNITDTQVFVDTGKEHLIEANKYFFRYTPILLGSALGALTLGPVGAVFLKMGGLLTLGGSIFGGLAGYKIQKI